MSDVGLNFSALDIFVYGAIIALPLTTILLVVLILGRLRIGRRGVRRGPQWALNAGIIAVGLLWATGAGVQLWLWIDGMVDEMRAASRHFTLTAERTIEGIALPAGSAVRLNDYDRLESITLPAGAVVTLDGADWRATLEFVPLYDTNAPAPARIRVGELVTDAAFEGIPCRGGLAVMFWGSGGLQSCTLAKDTPIRADIADAERQRRPARVTCAADRIVELQAAAETQVRGCTLAMPIAVQGIPCAAGSEIEIYDGRLIACTLAAGQDFNGLDIPAGSILHFTDTPQRVAQFALPAMSSPLSAFGMDLPSHVQVSLCRERWAVDQVAVSDNAYVEIAGVKLTGYLNFDCGLFHYGSLFEDSRIHGEIWASGRSVFREDLALPTAAKP